VARETKSEVPYGTLDLMILKTLESMGSLHGYGLARRIEQHPTHCVYHQGKPIV